MDNTKSGEIKEFQGETLNPPITYDYSYKTFETKQEAVGANAWPQDADTFVLARINKQAEASAKSAAYVKALEDKRKAYEETTEFKRKNLVAALVLAGKSKIEAEAIAAANVG